MLDKKTCKIVLNKCLSTGGDFAEIFEEEKNSTGIYSLNNVVEKVNSGEKYGIGLRIYKDQTSVYAYTNNDSLDSLLDVATKLSESYEGKQSVFCEELIETKVENINKIKKYPQDYALKDKVAIMEQVFKGADEYDEIITKVSINYSDSSQKVLIANSKGKYVKDNRVRTRLAASAIATDDNNMQNGYFAPGASMGLEFYEDMDLYEVGKKASKTAKTMLYADECPSGVMDVVINNGFGGVIFHEACGHSLEATSVARNNSVFSGKVGEKIASELVTVIDDGTIPNAWGSLNVDDEGNKTTKNVLIEKGILKGYMIDQLNGERMNKETTGSGRRQSYAYEPTSRMTNTYICNGESTFEEIIENTKFGLFAKSLGGGSVNPITGEFNFSVQEGYLIENGVIGKPVKGASLVGSGKDTLLKIDMVANNLLRAQGMCGSSSGSIPVDVGQPTIRVKNMTVGGRGGSL
jgi:TldD protein